MRWSVRGGRVSTEFIQFIKICKNVRHTLSPPQWLFIPLLRDLKQSEAVMYGMIFFSLLGPLNVRSWLNIVVLFMIS